MPCSIFPVAVGSLKFCSVIFHQRNLKFKDNASKPSCENHLACLKVVTYAVPMFLIIDESFINTGSTQLM